VHVALGNLYQFTGRREEAMREFELALASDPENVSALGGTGALYAQMHEFDKAEELLRRATGLQPGNWNPYNRLGAFYFNQGRYAEAAEQYGIVVALDNSNMIGQSNLATALIFAGDFERAAPVLEHSAEMEPRPLTYSNLGLMYYYLGRLDESIAAYTRATELAPDNHFPWSGLGDALWVSGREAEAIIAYRKSQSLALELLDGDPNDTYTLLDLAWISAMLDSPDEAQQYAGRAQQQLALDPMADYVVALVNVQAGRTDEAIDALEAAIDKGFSEKTLAVEPQLAPLRGDARFEALINRRQQ